MKKAKKKTPPQQSRGVNPTSLKLPLHELKKVDIDRGELPEEEDDLVPVFRKTGTKLKIIKFPRNRS